ncbi:IS30 family transposase, partial [Lactobacillus delbrueckii subsp. lactis]|nr:IS30 family transposase [Lactobacillus delbrueckii subsp. lactis]MCD5509406.1 IS30 family transposase [Lactobacillus delbrueckii subsp. lactis]MCD5511245.1 IS30 family transposase [Lactobacillus delbrueckii subsp. lactis]MCD5513100.1 IS30 family transposase [Lactobacillus delbrueckii subsp. lactis]
RRYIPKGDRMDKYSVEDIAKIEVWCNSLPRKILNYKTPEEYFGHCQFFCVNKSFR